MSLQGIEVAANVALKAGGMASKSLAVTLYAILTDRKKVKGKTRLNSMLKSGKELKVFAIHHNDLKTFTQEARRYGVLYCVLKEKCNTDGICDIMVRAEDAAKISRIVDKFELATIDTKAINDYAAAKQNSIQFKEADVLNVALFGMTAKEWRENNPNLKGNIRDHTDLKHLLILCNLENTNAELINDNIPQSERLIKLNDSAIRQMRVLENDKTIKELETLNKNLIETQ